MRLQTSRNVRLAALRTVAIYAFFAAVWILVSDNLLGWLVTDHDTVTKLAVFKGWLFVLLTSLLLYKLIVRDSLKLSETASRLKTSEERFHTIYNSLNDAIFIHDAATGRIVDVNETMCRMYGYTRAEVLQDNAFRLGTGVPPYSSAEARAWLQLAAQGTPQLFEWLTTAKDNHQFWVEVSMRHAVINGENLIVVLVRDITDRKKAAEVLDLQRRQLEELNQTLEKRVLDAIAELRQKDELLIQQSRNAAMGEMLNSIAHQWRQPLNNIAIYVQSIQLLREEGELTDEQLQSDVLSIMDIIHYMSKTIDDFRTFFRQEKQRGLFCLKESAEKALGLVSARLEHLGITSQLIVKQEPCTFGYASEYCQAVLNILNNAIDVLSYTEKLERRIVLSIDEQNGNAILLIRDTGGGIAPNSLPHLFEPYYTTKGPGEGSGIGLYMAKAIIEQHMAGTLTARNTADGAEFCIALPATARP